MSLNCYPVPACLAWRGAAWVLALTAPFNWELLTSPRLANVNNDVRGPGPALVSRLVGGQVSMHTPPQGQGLLWQKWLQPFMKEPESSTSWPSLRPEYEWSLIRDSEEEARHLPGDSAQPVPAFSCHPQSDTNVQIPLGMCYKPSSVPGTLPELTQLILLRTLSSSVQFSRSVMSDSLRTHEPQHARPPCPSSNVGV